MLKKLLLLSLVLFICFCAFAVDNNQKIYPVNSQVYKDISTLYVLTGHSLPSTAGPWSKEELSNMVQEIDTSGLSAAGLKIYSRVLSELGREPDREIGGNAAMSFDIIANVETYSHTYNREKAIEDGNTRKALDGVTDYAFEGRDWWFGKDITKATPFCELNWEAWIAENLYSFLNISGQNVLHYRDGIGKTNFNTNIMFLQNGKLDVKSVDGNIPYRAFAALGGKYWSVQVGRDRLNWGGATTGNLAIADTMPYYDNIRATAFTKNFKYTYLISFFPNKMNYYDTDTSIYNTYRNSTEAQKGLSMYIGHRFEGRFFHDKLSLSVAEAVMYESRDNSMVWTMLSPMHVLHNLYIGNNTNSTMTFEATYTPFKRFNLYGQFLLDQIAGLGEKGPGAGKSEDTVPNATAAILGAKFITDFAGGTLTINPEGAYVGAYTYLRNGDGSSPDFGLDYIAAVRTIEFSTQDASYTDYVVGYKYGPDCIVGALNASWEKDKLTAKAKFFGMIHGTHDLWTKYQEVPANTTQENYNSWYVLPTTDNRSGSNYKYDVTGRNAKWITLDFGAGASYRFTDALEVSCFADYVVMKNIFNVEGKNAKDFQLIVGAKYKIL